MGHPVVHLCCMCPTLGPSFLFKAFPSGLLGQSRFLWLMWCNNWWVIFLLLILTRVHDLKSWRVRRSCHQIVLKEPPKHKADLCFCTRSRFAFKWKSAMRSMLDTKHIVADHINLFDVKTGLWSLCEFMHCNYTRCQYHSHDSITIDTLHVFIRWVIWCGSHHLTILFHQSIYSYSWQKERKKSKLIKHMLWLAFSSFIMHPNTVQPCSAKCCIFFFITHLMAHYCFGAFPPFGSEVFPWGEKKWSQGEKESREMLSAVCVL